MRPDEFNTVERLQQIQSLIDTVIRKIKKYNRYQGGKKKAASVRYGRSPAGRAADKRYRSKPAVRDHYNRLKLSWTQSRKRRSKDGANL